MRYNDPDSGVPSCKSCGGDCKTCEINAEVITCTSCKHDFQFNSLGTSCVSCYENNKELVIFSSLNNPNCFSCSNSNCLKCGRFDIKKCEQCVANKYIPYSTRNDDVTPCLECDTSDGTKVINGVYCLSGSDCTPNCKLCSTSSFYECDTCNDKFFLTASKPCSPCHSDCATCSTANKCTSCLSNKYLMDGFCVDCSLDWQKPSGKPT